jgi:hypothetical protein
LLQEARDRGNLYGETNLSTFVVPLVRLAADDPAGARRELCQGMRQWSQQGFHLQHLTCLYDEGQIDLYLGNPLASWERLVRQGPALARSLLLRIQQLRIFILHIRARTALAAARHSSQAAFFLHTADRATAQLEREGLPWPDALAKLLRAGIAAARAEASAATFLSEAIARLEPLEMSLHAAAAQRRLGELTGGDEGRSLVARADARLRGHRIVNPERMTAMLVPGFFG